MNVSGDELQESEFYLDVDPETTFEGFTKGDTWNGWACPYFEKETAKRIAEHYEEINRYGDIEEYRAEYDSRQDLFLFHSPEYEQPREFGPVQVGDSKLYPIGAYCWTWCEKK